ncbi:hypothetical protein QHF89_37095, partial [Polyangium sorediatum]
MVDSPIPPPKDDDDEDVHWALSTASALWGRGERAEALRWLKRAAEQASDADKDMRSLELFKAAADIAPLLAAAAAAAAAPQAAPAPAPAPAPQAAAAPPPPAPSPQAAPPPVPQAAPAPESAPQAP